MFLNDLKRVLPIMYSPQIVSTWCLLQCSLYSSVLFSQSKTKISKTNLPIQLHNSPSSHVFRRESRRNMVCHFVIKQLRSGFSISELSELQSAVSAANITIGCYQISLPEDTSSHEEHFPLLPSDQGTDSNNKHFYTICQILAESIFIEGLMCQEELGAFASIVSYGPLRALQHNREEI